MKCPLVEIIMPNYASEIEKVLAVGRGDLKAATNETVKGVLGAYKAGVDEITARYEELAEMAAKGDIKADNARKMLLPIKKAAEADMMRWAAIASGHMDFGTAKAFLAGYGFAGAVGELKDISFRMGTSDRLAFQAAYVATKSGPLHDLLKSIAKTTVDDAALAVRNSIMASEGYKKMSKRLQAATTASAARCDLIARTEVARAYRDATLHAYEQMGVSYVRWMSAEQTRTCSACWANDGKVYEMGKVPNDHPRGRCKLLALSDSEVEELKDEFGDNWREKLHLQNIEANTAILKKKPASELELIFGSKKQATLFVSGAPLQACVRTVKSPKWGVSVASQSFLSVTHAQEMAEAQAARIAQLQMQAAALAEAQAANDDLLAEEAAQQHKEALKVELSQMSVAALKLKAKAEISTYVGSWKDATKADLIEILSGADPVAVAKAYENMASKHQAWIVKSKLNAAKAKEVAKEAEQEALLAAQKAQEALLVEQAAKAAHRAAVAQEKALAKAAKEAEIKKAQEVAEAKAAEEEAMALHQAMIEADALAKAQAKKAEKAQAAKVKKVAKEAQAKLEADALQAKLEAELAETYAKFKAEQAAAEVKVTKAQAAKAKKEAKDAKVELENATVQNVEAHADAKAKKKSAKTASSVSVDKTPSKGKKAAVSVPDFDAIDAFWEANHGEDRWRYEGVAQLGGMHSKEIYVDASGARWLFKPERREPWRCHADEASYKVGRLIKPDTIEVRAVTLNGVTGTIQKLETNLAPVSNFKGVNIQTLSMDEKGQVLSEQVIDWLIGNHDSHPENFLRLNDGRVMGIDKGQAYKFMGRDKLTIDYSPNPVPPLYNTLLQAAKAGVIEIDPSAILPYIEAVEAITDAQYVEIMTPYVRGRFAGKPQEEVLFYRNALARKNSIRADFEKLYGVVTGNAKFKFNENIKHTEPKKVSAPAPVKELVVDAVEQAQKVGW